MRQPPGLGARGRRLWADTVAMYELDPHQFQVLLGACRLADRLEVLAVRAKAELPGAVREERDEIQQLNRQLLALRLPDAVTGKRPQRSHGSQKPSQVTSLRDRFRESG